MALLSLRTALVTTCALCWSTTGALALDADDFGQKLAAAYQVLGLDFDYAAATAEGDTVVLSDFTLNLPGAEPLELPGDLTFTGVVENPDGSYFAELASIADIDVEDEDEEGQFSLTNIRIEGVRVPAVLDINDLESMMLYDRIQLGPANLVLGGAEIVTVELIETYMEADEDLTEFVSGFSMQGVRLDLASLDAREEGEAAEVLDFFGINTLDLDINGIAVWYPETGFMDLEDMRIDLHQLGAVTVTASVSGYTLELYREMLDIQAKMNEMGQDLTEEDIAAVDEAMLELFSELELHSVSLTYDDASLVGKALEFAGREQGISGADFANGIRFMVPMFLSELGNEEFSAQVSAAVNAFLDDPQTLRVRAEPTEPLRIETLAEAAEANPLSLIDLLNVQIEANP